MILVLLRLKPCFQFILCQFPVEVMVRTVDQLDGGDEERWVWSITLDIGCWNLCGQCRTTQSSTRVGWRFDGTTAKSCCILYIKITFSTSCIFVVLAIQVPPSSQSHLLSCTLDCNSDESCCLVLYAFHFVDYICSVWVPDRESILDSWWSTQRWAFHFAIFGVPFRLLVSLTTDKNY